VQGSPPECRARARSAEKKTGLTRFAASSGECLFATAYEQLRTGALAGVGTGSHFGLVVLLREGVAAWIASAPAQSVTETPARKERPVPRAATPLVDDGIHAAMVAILANMVTAIPEEKCA